MRTILSLFLALFAFGIVGCKDNSPSGSTTGTATGPSSGTAASTAPPSGGGAVSLAGQGATFPAPLYAKWIQEYGNVEKNVKINYQAVGSGAGINHITDKTSDFGASDAPMTDEQL